MQLHRHWPQQQFLMDIIMIPGSISIVISLLILSILIPYHHAVKIHIVLHFDTKNSIYWQYCHDYLLTGSVLPVQAINHDTTVNAISANKKIYPKASYRYLTCCVLLLSAV